MDPPDLPTAPTGDRAESDPNNNEQEKGEQGEGDCGDEVPEADRAAPGSPACGDAGGDPAASARGEPLPGAGALVELRAAAPPRVNPYSVIDISPFQGEAPPSPEPAVSEEGGVAVPSGYSVPVPCGYAVPCSLPALVPAYTSPVLLRSSSCDDQAEAPEVAADSQLESLGSEGPTPSDNAQEDNALARWAADPANTAWMDNAEEAVYDDVPRENSDSEPEEMVYDDVENGDGGGNSSVDYGWSSSEFESYEEQSDSECRHGVPRSFLRSSHRKQLSRDLARLKEHYERRVRELMASTVAAVEMQQLRQKHELKMQKLVKAAKEGTKDGLERTKAAVRRGRSFIRSHSLLPQDPRDGLDEEQNPFIDVECQHPEAVLTPMPEGLSQQQVVRRYILGAIVDSEKNYVDSLQRILEHYEKPLSQMEPRILSERKLKVIFHRVKEVLQCHSLFQIALASRVAEWDSVEMIGDVFVASFSKSMVLDAYSEYVNNFSSAVAILKKTCATKPAFLEFLKQSQENSPDRTTLYSLMTKPIQRFPQFILLLQDMLKHTCPGHPDRLPLQMALTELETLAEKLNERKRDADQRCEMKRIAKAANERYLNKLLSTGSRYLVRSDDMVETVYSDRGEMLKTKERRLFMLNDVLMCATVSARSQDGSTTTSPGHRYLLKWSVPLGHVEPIEYGSNEGTGEHGRGSPEHPHESLLLEAASKPSGGSVGPGQLHQDLQNLLHDLAVLGQISQLIGTLRGHYQNLNTSVAQDWTAGLRRLILKKEEDIRAAACCRLQLQLPGKPDKSGRPTFFSAEFNTLSPAVKASWLQSLHTAKLGLEEDNHLGWFCVEDDGNQMKKDRHPLLVGHVPVTVAKQQDFKIECAAYNPEPLGESQPDLPASGHGFLWVGSCAGQMGQVAIVSFQNSSPKVLECFNVESRILCMVYVPSPEPTPEAAHPAAGPTICLGTEEGSISTYKSRQGAKKVRLQLFFSPNKSSVLALACTPHGLYAGLVNGTVAIYARAEDGTWSPEPQQVVVLGVLPVRSLLLTEDTLWAACGGQVALIGLGTHALESRLEAHQDEGMVVSHMAIAGVGIWVAFTMGCTLRLFHTETLQHLQDVNVATPVHHMLPGHQHLCVSSLLVCHGLLMVGTSLGFVVALPVPRLQGIPKVTGRGMVSYHAHSGPVKFLLMVSATLKKDRERPPDSPPPSDPQGEELQGVPPEGPASPDAAVWLGGSSGPALLRGGFSSSSGSLTPSQGSSSLDLRPEDGTLGDLLLQPQGPPSGGRRGLRARTSSVLVACGGQGHRRLSRRGRQQRPEELASSLMVWQLHC
ncbi:rho guanine nucleotide exchange factor 10 isoform X1 [Sorex araneus]|uniref:rho guanine nucleotide exchange factor 10 isoform X1 n=1 Tax=Sorex araneus TaxID=42254 RepID=UPI0024336C14|nr:rho guanine nucleotide exchange factor 10 isoform X1 [Sorex araneus]XP_054978140.1 rho guanine nucleotide exchange factor 10 isoform X1 [Sorex araneus]